MPRPGSPAMTDRQPDFAEYQRRLRRAYDDVATAQHWFATTAWDRLRHDTMTARSRGVTWADIERWLGSEITELLRHELIEPKRPPRAESREPDIVESTPTGLGRTEGVWLESRSELSMQSTSLSIVQNSFQASYSPSIIRPKAGLLLLAGNPHPGQNNFEVELGAIQEVAATSTVFAHPELNVSLDGITRHVDMYRPDVLHLSAHNEAGVCLRGPHGHKHVGEHLVVEAIAESDHRPLTVVLNFCRSGPVAIDLSAMYPTIGWPGALPDGVAEIWSRSFYQHYLLGWLLDRCVRTANRAIEDYDVPQAHLEHRA